MEKHKIEIMRILHIILALMASGLASNLASGQTITGVDAFQSGNEIIVEYNIEGTPGLPANTLFSVIPSFSTDGGKQFTALRSISGDIKDVPARSGNRIIWRVTEDYVSFVHSNVIFKVDFAGTPPRQTADEYYLKGQECEKAKKYADAIKYYRLSAQNGNKMAEKRIRELQLYFW